MEPPSLRSSHTDTASQISVSRVTTDAHGNEVPAVHGAFQAAFLARKNKLAEGRREKHDAEQRKELAEHEFKVARLREEEERRLELERAKDEMKSAKDSLNLRQADFLVAHPSELARKEHVRKMKGENDVAPNPYDTSLYGTVQNCVFQTRRNVKALRQMLDLVFGFSSEIDPADLESAEVDLMDPEGKVHVINPERSTRRILLKYAQLLDTTMPATQKEVLRQSLKTVANEYVQAFKDAKVDAYNASDPVGPHHVAHRNRDKFLHELFPGASWNLQGPAADFTHMNQQDAAAAALAASRNQTFHRGSNQGIIEGQYAHEEAFGSQEELGVSTWTLEQGQVPEVRDGEPRAAQLGGGNARSAAALRGVVRFVSRRTSDPEAAVKHGYGRVADEQATDHAGNETTTTANEVGAAFRRVPRAWKPGAARSSASGSLAAAVAALKGGAGS